MANREHPDPRSSIKALIALELRKFRELHKITGGQAGKIMGTSVGTVSKIEYALSSMKEDHAAALDEYGDTGGKFASLVLLAEQQPDEDWDKDHSQYETRAVTLKLWEPGYVPGLFQTPAYARANFISTGVRPDNVDRLVERRMQRRERITRMESPQLIWALLDEGVLDRPAGGADVMCEQLAHLLELTRLHNVSIRVVRRRVGLHVGIDGQFKLMYLPNRTAAYSEAAIGWRTITDPLKIGSFETRYDRIGELAIPADETRDLIREKMEQMR